MAVLALRQESLMRVVVLACVACTLAVALAGSNSQDLAGADAVANVQITPNDPPIRRVQVDFNPAPTLSSLSSASQGDASGVTLTAPKTTCSFALREGESPYAIFAPSKPTSTSARVQAVLDVVLPAAVKAVNWTARQSGNYATWFRPSHWFLPSDVESMLRVASWCTGLNDFGDTGFLKGLALCVHVTEKYASLTPFGRIAIWLDVQRMLQGCPRLIDCRNWFPEIEEQQVRAPMVILGMPRTGTTLLYNLLSLDYERFRSPRAWECRYVYPPP
ncbi:unnamed protein product [Closterium sp. Naga37s-1]|nr:unnamed protein product [Closterium sp. Naga37s-1]